MKAQSKGEGSGNDQGQGGLVEMIPGLEQGFNRLEKPEDLPVFQALTASELKGGGKAVWLDSRNQCSTYALARHDPDLMRRVEIGRAFTPFQHNELLTSVEEFVDPETRLLVLPQVTFLYEDGGTKEWESRELLEEAWEAVEESAERHGFKVVYSLADGTSLNHLVTSPDHGFIEASPTDQGMNYSSEEFEQMVYRKGRGFQTTVPYWQRKKQERRREVAVEAT